jgi:hypothetical protein
VGIQPRENEKKKEEEKKSEKKKVEKIKKYNFYVNRKKLKMLIFLTCL